MYEDAEIVETALKTSSSAYVLLPKKLKENREIAMRSVKYHPKVF